MSRLDRLFELDGLGENIPVNLSGFEHAESRDRKIANRATLGRRRFFYKLLEEGLKADLAGRSPERRLIRTRILNQAYRLILGLGISGNAFVQERVGDILDRDPDTYQDWADMAPDSLWRTAKVDLRQVKKSVLLPQDKTISDIQDPFLASFFENYARPLRAIATYTTTSFATIGDLHVLFASRLHLADAHTENPQVISTWQPYTPAHFKAVSITNGDVVAIVREHPTRPQKPKIPFTQVVDIQGNEILEVTFIPSDRDQFKPVVPEQELWRVPDKGVQLPRGHLHFTWEGRPVNITPDIISRVVLATRGMRDTFHHDISREEVTLRRRKLELERENRLVKLYHKVIIS
ncbi:hypothetical protein HYS91_04945 [Candidatus Daviesbacteria bacterium]|nr:hypothetical protein [Candidatus Daviesbacteria bacterium]